MKWENYDDYYNTWEKIENLNNLLSEYFDDVDKEFDFKIRQFLSLRKDLKK